MFNNIFTIAEFIVNYIGESFIHIWPYLLVTIPIAVAVQMSGASKYINRAFTARPIAAILLATIVGAFSPLCSCSVIPVVAALLIGGVPLAPVMSFWLASPSMDPEIFFLTIGTLGWELAVWRLGATLVMSLGGSFITHFFVQRGLLGKNILRETNTTQVKTLGEVLKKAWQVVVSALGTAFAPQKAPSLTISSGTIAIQPNQPLIEEETRCGCGEDSNATECSLERDQEAVEVTVHESTPSFWKRLGEETWTATTLVIKFMLLAWLLGALIQLFVPETWITSVLGKNNPWAVVTAAFLGIPVYTSNLTAMPLVGGLLAQGMHPGAALAFLIAGPTTTLPAMSAVWGLVNRKTFSLYIGFSLLGAIVLGSVYSFTL